MRNTIASVSNLETRRAGAGRELRDRIAREIDDAVEIAAQLDYDGYVVEVEPPKPGS